MHAAAGPEAHFSRAIDHPDQAGRSRCQHRVLLRRGIKRYWASYQPGASMARITDWVHKASDRGRPKTCSKVRWRKAATAPREAAITPRLASRFRGYREGAAPAGVVDAVPG